MRFIGLCCSVASFDSSESQRAASESGPGRACAGGDSAAATDVPQSKILRVHKPRSGRPRSRGLRPRASAACQMHRACSFARVVHTYTAPSRNILSGTWVPVVQCKSWRGRTNECSVVLTTLATLTTARFASGQGHSESGPSCLRPDSTAIPMMKSG